VIRAVLCSKVETDPILSFQDLLEARMRLASIAGLKNDSAPILLLHRCSCMKLGVECVLTCWACALTEEIPMLNMVSQAPDLSAVHLLRHKVRSQMRVGTIVRSANCPKVPHRSEPRTRQNI
jgi:hypothetical protein